MTDEPIMGIAPPAETAKRGMSDEHKKAMAEGRERAKANRATTRGRPALRTERLPLPREMSPEMTEEQRILEDLNRQIAAVESGETRVSRDAVGGLLSNSFNIPLQGRRQGWDYEYKTVKVNGEEVDSSDLIDYRNGGWIPVPRTDFPTEVPADWKGAFIDRRGQRMYMRPQRLTDEARAEAYNNALQVKHDKLEGALAGEGGRDVAPRRLPDGRPATSFTTTVERQPLL